MTAAHNEEAFLEATIRSVVGQTVRPQRWVIVSDNSSDGTDRIIESYARQHDFIRFLRITRAPGHSFGAKVIALHQGCELLEDVEYEFIGNLDADITLENSYFEQLIDRFRMSPRLGLVGGFVHEDAGTGFRSRPVNDARNVAHAAQLMRRECYDAIGGYAVLKYGGEDWCAQIKVRMLGWEVEAVPALKIFHHRHTGGGSHWLRNALRLGHLDYSFGSDPMFEVMKCLKRVAEKPYILAAAARLAGFVWPSICRERRELPADFISYLRQEQRERLWSRWKRVPPSVPAVPVPPQNSFHE